MQAKRFTDQQILTILREGEQPDKNETHVDHIISKSKGGDGSPSNGQVLCRECNLEKSNK